MTETLSPLGGNRLGFRSFVIVSDFAFGVQVHDGYAATRCRQADLVDRV